MFAPYWNSSPPLPAVKEVKEVKEEGDLPEVKKETTNLSFQQQLDAASQGEVTKEEAEDSRCWKDTFGGDVSSKGDTSPGTSSTGGSPPPEIKMLYTEIHKLEVANKNLKEGTLKSKKDYDRLQAAKDALEEDHAVLKTAKDALEEDHAVLKTAKDALEEDHDVLKTAYATLEKKLKKLNFQFGETRRLAN